MNEFLSPGIISILWLIRCVGLARIAYAVFRWRAFLRGVRGGWLISLGLLAALFALFCFVAPILGYFLPEWFYVLTVISAVGISAMATAVGEILNFIVRRSFRLLPDDQRKVVDVSAMVAYADRKIAEKTEILEESRKIHASAS